MTCKRPTAEQVRSARETVQADLGLGITEAQDWCAGAVCSNRRSWQRWETGEREMHAAFWDLFCRKLSEGGAGNG